MAKTKRCPGCGREYTGKSTRAIVEGESRLVCVKCVASAVKVVTLRPVNGVCKIAACQNVPHYCTDHYEANGRRRIMYEMGPIVRAIQARADAYTKRVDDAAETSGVHLEGVIEGLEMAVEMIRTGNYFPKG